MGQASASPPVEKTPVIYGFINLAVLSWLLFLVAGLLLGFAISAAVGVSEDFHTLFFGTHLRYIAGVFAAVDALRLCRGREPNRPMPLMILVWRVLVGAALVWTVSLAVCGAVLGVGSYVIQYRESGSAASIAAETWRIWEMVMRVTLAAALVVGFFVRVPGWKTLGAKLGKA